MEKVADSNSVGEEVPHCSSIGRAGKREKRILLSLISVMAASDATNVEV